jgi:hypothetical protein
VIVLDNLRTGFAWAVAPERVGSPAMLATSGWSSG